MKRNFFGRGMALLLAVVLLAGTVTSGQMRGVSERYVAAAEELYVLSAQGEWQRAAETAAAYLADWRRLVPLLQMLINHEDIDDVTLALERLQAAIDAKEQGSCYEACAELRENARHIYHRDAFTPGNVL